jgi:hypothetical protein
VGVVAAAAVVVVVVVVVGGQPFVLRHCYFKTGNTTTVYESSQFSRPHFSVPI